jgi:hypothetical protein
MVAFAVYQLLQAPVKMPKNNSYSIFQADLASYKSRWILNMTKAGRLGGCNPRTQLAFL